MNDHRFKKLLEGYLAESLTSGQLRAFLKAATQRGSDELLLQHLDQKIRQAPTGADNELTAERLERFRTSLKNPPAPVVKMPPVQRFAWRRIATVAAAVIVFIGIAFFIIKRDGRVDKVPPNSTALIAVAADHSAQLQLGAGSYVVLDSQAVSSAVLSASGIIFKPDSNRLEYGQQTTEIKTGAPQSLSTGRGAQVSVVLSDGTRVWLNAKSALRYPVPFLPSARVVELSGEAYFEVQPDPVRPFQVRTTRTTTLTVLGTAFNLKAYATDSATVAGVYQGRVQVSDNRQQTTLSAGQQLVIGSDGGWHAGSSSDLDAATSWKSNLFVFRSARLPAIVAELSRWYSVNFEIGPGITRTFSGTIPRSEDLATVLEILKESGITYRKDGTKIVFFREQTYAKVQKSH